jgi:hypothetical protein
MGIELRWIYKIIPVPVFYRRIMRPGFAGVSRTFFIVIKPELRNKGKILEHELIHCKQFYRTLGLNILLNNLSHKYRYKSELEAYGEQVRLGGLTAKEAAEFIVSSYRIPDLTVEKVIGDLRTSVFRIMN